MAIEIGADSKDKKKGGLFLIFLSFILILAFSGGYAYLFFLSKEVRQEISEKASEVQEIKRERKDAETEVLRYKKIINDFKGVLDGHKNIVRIFPIVEGLTHPNVRFTRFSFSISSETASLTGLARDFTSLGQQMMILRDVAEIREVSVSGIRDTEEGVSFSLSFKVSSQILR